MSCSVTSVLNMSRSFVRRAAEPQGHRTEQNGLMGPKVEGFGSSISTLLINFISNIDLRNA